MLIVLDPLIFFYKIPLYWETQERERDLCLSPEIPGGYPAATDFIRLYERQNCPKSDLYGSTQVESPICRARSQMCTQYRLGVRFVRACHLALVRYDEIQPVKDPWDYTDDYKAILGIDM